MKANSRVLGLAAMGCALIGWVGCAEDNNKEVVRDTPRSKVEVSTDAPKTQEEMYRMQKGQGTGSLKGYRPGGGRPGGR